MSQFDFFFDHEKQIHQKFEKIKHRKPNESEQRAIFLNLFRFHLRLKPMKSNQTVVKDGRLKRG